MNAFSINLNKNSLNRQKIGYTQQDSAQFHDLTNGVILGFERADATRKVRIVLSELFFIQAQIIEQNQQKSEISIKSSELFDNEIYLEEIADIICIALAELPSLLQVHEIVEILLYVNNGSSIICWIVANMPDCFREVVTSLIVNSDEDTPEGKLRLTALNSLCEINPAQALSTRALCVQLKAMPSLMLKLSLADSQDLVAFLTGLLLGIDQNTRAWFAQFVKTSQKKKGEILQSLRDKLSSELNRLLLCVVNDHLPDQYVVESAALLRLYCALRGIAGLKLNDDEMLPLLCLVTSKPPPTPSGIHFVSLGLCMLIALPSLLSALESKAVEWIQWLMREEAYFERCVQLQRPLKPFSH
jgi:integrator complex subunit 2